MLPAVLLQDETSFHCFDFANAQHALLLSAGASSQVDLGPPRESASLDASSHDQSSRFPAALRASKGFQYSFDNTTTASQRHYLLL
jgi:hypothetical protein